MKTLSSLFLVFLLLTGCNHRPFVSPHEFLIEGSISELPDSSIVLLYKSEGRLLKQAASDTVFNGHFTFRDTVSTTIKYAIRGRGLQFPNTWVDLWVTPGSYTRITGQGTNLKTWIYDSEVAEQQYENALLDATRADWEKLGSEMVKVNQWFELVNKNRGNDSIRRLARTKIDSIRLQSDPIQDEMIVKEMEMLNKMPVSAWSLDKLEEYMMMLQYDPKHPVVPLLLKAAERLSEADRQTPSGKVIMSYVNLPKAVGIGDEMVDGELYDTDGQLHHLDELKGKYILLDFWSRGCGPCVASIPEMEEITQLYASRLAVVSISEDGESSWKEFIREKNMKGLQWNQLDETDHTLKQAYRIDAIPGYVLISPEGKVIDKWSGYGKNSLKNKLKSLLP